MNVFQEPGWGKVGMALKRTDEMALVTVAVMVHDVGLRFALFEVRNTFSETGNVHELFG